MSYVPTFAADVFFSYGHIDNEPVLGQEPWVKYFHLQLERRLAQLLGESVSIWRDERLQGNDYLTDEILEKIGKAAVVISVLSPRYLKSDWCQKELKAFFEAAQRTGGLRVGNVSRLFGVVKTRVPPEEYPVELSDSIGYEFLEEREQPRVAARPRAVA